jgi:hypothetical protein
MRNSKWQWKLFDLNGLSNGLEFDPNNEGLKIKKFALCEACVDQPNL